jgi:hypothetical protein
MTYQYIYCYKLVYMCVCVCVYTLGVYKCMCACMYVYLRMYVLLLLDCVRSLVMLGYNDARHCKFMGSPACHINLGNQSSSAASFLALAHSRVSNTIRFSGVLKVCVDLTFF